MNSDEYNLTKDSIVHVSLSFILHIPIAGQDNLVFASNSVLEKINLSPFSLSSLNLEVNSDGNNLPILQLVFAERSGSVGRVLD